MNVIAQNLNDVSAIKTFHLHSLSGNLNGYFAIDMGSRRSSYRLIIEPINNGILDKSNLSKYYEAITIVEIEEVSKHYE